MVERSKKFVSQGAGAPNRVAIEGRRGGELGRVARQRVGLLVHVVGSVNHDGPRGKRPMSTSDPRSSGEVTDQPRGLIPTPHQVFEMLYRSSRQDAASN